MRHNYFCYFMNATAKPLGAIQSLISVYYYYSPMQHCVQNYLCQTLVASKTFSSFPELVASSFCPGVWRTRGTRPSPSAWRRLRIPDICIYGEGSHGAGCSRTRWISSVRRKFASVMPILIRCLHKDQSREMLEHWFTYNFHAIADGQIHYSKKLCKHHLSPTNGNFM